VTGGGCCWSEVGGCKRPHSPERNPIKNSFKQINQTKLIPQAYSAKSGGSLAGFAVGCVGAARTGLVAAAGNDNGRGGFVGVVAASGPAAAATVVVVGDGAAAAVGGDAAVDVVVVAGGSGEGWVVFEGCGSCGVEEQEK